MISSSKVEKGMVRASSVISELMIDRRWNDKNYSNLLGDVCMRYSCEGTRGGNFGKNCKLFFFKNNFLLVLKNLWKII
jgi:hypothetical protein